MQDPWMIAIGNVLARKRGRRLELQTKLDDYIRKRETPEKGLSSEIAVLGQEIRALEAAAEIARAESRNVAS